MPHFAPPVSADVVKLGEIVLGAAADTIDFTSIPQTYRHLLIKGRLKMINNAAASNFGLGMGFNGDLRAGSSVLYDAVRKEWVGGGAVGSNNNLGTPYFQQVGNIPQTPSGTYSCDVDIEINDYARTTFEKTVKARCVSSTGLLIADHIDGLYECRWRSTTAVSRVTLFAAFSATNMDIGSMATLYGVK